MVRMMGFLTLGAAAVSSALSLPAVALAQRGAPYDDDHMWGGGWHGWFMGPIMMIAVIAVAIVAIVLFVRWLGGIGHGPAPSGARGKTALDILKERFARGEIDKEEFEQRRRILEE